jgi:hypothetical protein
MVSNSNGRCHFFGKVRELDGFFLGDRIRNTGKKDCGYSTPPSGVWAAHGIGSPAGQHSPREPRKDRRRLDSLKERIGGPARSRGLNLSGGDRPDAAYTAQTVARHSIRHPLTFRLRSSGDLETAIDMSISAGKAGYK